MNHIIEVRGKVQLIKINYHSEEYSQELELRDRVLRKSLGMSLYDENLEKEQYDVHIGAFLNNQLIGVLILTKKTDTVVKMRQVAVDEAFRSQKTGSKMVVFAEEYAKRMGYTTMELNARKTAVSFYEKLGYDKIGEEFLEINILHSEMRKILRGE